MISPRLLGFHISLKKARQKKYIYMYIYNLPDPGNWQLDQETGIREDPWSAAEMKVPLGC